MEKVLWVEYKKLPVWWVEYSPRDTSKIQKNFQQEFKLFPEETHSCG
jgi:hypothetical protein